MENLAQTLEIINHHVRFWPYAEIAERWTTLFKNVPKGLRLWLAVESAVPYEGLDFNGHQMVISFRPESSYMLEDNFYTSILTDFIKEHFGDHVTVNYYIKGDLKIEFYQPLVNDYKTHENKSVKTPEIGVISKAAAKLLTISIENKRLWSVFCNVEYWELLGFSIRDKISVHQADGIIKISRAAKNDSNGRYLHATSAKRASVKFPREAVWNDAFANVDVTTDYAVSLVNGEIIIDLSQDGTALNIAQLVTPVVVLVSKTPVHNNVIPFYAESTAIKNTQAPSADVKNVITITKTDTKLNLFSEKDLFISAGFAHLCPLTFELTKESISLVHTDKSIKYDNTKKARVSESGGKWSMSFIISGQDEAGNPLRDKFDHLNAGHYLATLLEGKIMIDLNKVTSKPSRISRATKEEAPAIQDKIDPQTPLFKNAETLELVPKDDDKTEAKVHESTDENLFEAHEEKDSASLNLSLEALIKKPAEKTIEKAVDVVQAMLIDMDPAGLHSRMSGLKSIFTNLCYPHDVNVAMQALFNYRNLMSEEEMLYMHVKNILESRQLK